MEQIILQGISPDELLKKIEALIDKKLSSYQHSHASNAGELITRKETAILLKVSLPTLHDWTNQGWLQSYRIGNRVLYKPEEVKSALIKGTQRKYRKFQP